MTSFRIATQTARLGQTLRKALHTASLVGAEGVQFDARRELRPSELSETGLRQLRKLLDDLNLRVGSVAFPTRRGYANPIDLERRLDATLGAMQLASELRSNILIVQLGKLPGDQNTREFSTLTESLELLFRNGNRLGVRLAAQLSFDRCQQVHEFFATLTEGAVSLDLHPANLIGQGHSPEEFVTGLGEHIAHVHASDAVRELGAGSCLEVELGRGLTDFPAVIGQLEEYGYRGWVTIERTEGPNPLEDISNAVTYLRTLQHSV